MIKINEINLSIENILKTKNNVFIYKCRTTGLFIDVISKYDLNDKIKKNVPDFNKKLINILILKNVELVSSMRIFDLRKYYSHKIFIGFDKKK